MNLRYPFIITSVIRDDDNFEAFGIYNKSYAYLFLKELVEDRLLSDQEVADLLKKYNLTTSYELEEVEEVYVDDFSGEVFEYGTRVYNVYLLNYFQAAIFILDNYYKDRYVEIISKFYKPIFKFFFKVNGFIFSKLRYLIRVTEATYTVTNKQILIIHED